MSRGTVLIVVAWLLCVAPQNAHAQSYPSPAVFIAVTVIGGGLGASVAVGSVVTLIGGARDLALGRATRAWRIANYVLGVLDILIGIPLAAVYVSTHATFEPAVGIPLIAVGVADVGIAIVSSSRASRSSIAIAPIVGRDPVAGVHGGAGIVARF